MYHGRLRMAGFLLLVLATASACSTRQQWVATAPAGLLPTRIAVDGTTVIPNGRLLTPIGRQYRVAPHPYGLVLSADGKTAVTANSGVRPFSLSILENVLDGGPGVAVHQIPEGAETDEGVLAAVFMGLAISPDNERLYVGGGAEGSVVVFDLQSRQRVGELNANVVFDGREFEDSYVGDLALSADGKLLYAVDQTNFRLLIFNVDSASLVSSVPVGRYPFGLSLTPDETRVLVANVGQFEYSVIAGDGEEEDEEAGISFPAFGYGSREAEVGTEAEGLFVPGLGDPNAIEAYSVWSVDVSNPAAAHVTARVKTGRLVGEEVAGQETVGGASPNSLVSTNTHAYVSNGNNDTISVIDLARDTVVSTIELTLDDRLGELRGTIPFGLALSPDGSRLFVAEAGINAVGIIDTRTDLLIGHLPTGWFPSKIAVSPDGKRLLVANAKGHGSGPNGGDDFELGPEGSYVGNLMFGYVNVIPIPPDDSLRAYTQQVVRNNFAFTLITDSLKQARSENPIPIFPGERESPIRHIVFVVKENRTYDEVFGQVAAGRGDPELARFGEGIAVSSRDGSRHIDGITVAPNHLKLAREFGIGDNFYCDSDVSADGHRWLVGVYPNEWTETSVAASYGGGRRLRVNSTAPGVLSFVGSSGAIYPEDYNEAGSIWDHFDRFGVDFFNFGLGFEFAGAAEEQEYKLTGVLLPINYPLPAPLMDRTSRKFATYNTSIPDQFRLEMFLEEFEARWGAGKDTLPQVLTVFLPQDHGAGERPADGYPFFQSYMADNDLALGRLVEFLSQTPYWSNMAIVVTEDDPQGGVDHVDAHRSILMVISPYSRRGYISPMHYSFGSIMKTFWNLLGASYLNQYDAGATDLSDFFTAAPDTTPYEAVAPDVRLFDPQRALDPMDASFNWQALSKAPPIDDVELMQQWSREQDRRRDEDAAGSR